MAEPLSGQVESREDFGKGAEGEATRWKTEFALARKGRRKIWLERYRKISNRYRLESENKSDSSVIEAQGAANGMNILWSNVRTKGPQIYAKPPKVVVERNYHDGSLEARAACVILERTLMYQMRAKGGQFHRMMKACRLDFQLAAKAQSRVRYEQDKNYRDDLSRPLMPSNVKYHEGVADESICWDYKHPDDILYPHAKTWHEIGWIAYRSFMTKEEIKGCEIFGDRAEEVAKDIAYKSRPEGMSNEEAEKPENGALMRAEIWAIFDKTDRKIHYFCEHWDEILISIDSPSTLDGFFPSPEPARDTVTNDTIEPVPEFTEYGAQANELDDLTSRAAMVLQNVKVAGVYNEDHEGLKNLLTSGVENKLIPIKNWGSFAEAGGLEGAMDTLPIKDYADVLNILYQARTIVKQDTDQMSGVFDIMRGQSDPNEKLGTQKLKTGFGDMRSSEPKDEMARFARDNLAIAGEIIAEHFSPGSLWQMSNFDLWWNDQQKGLIARFGGQNTQGALPAAPPQPGPPMGPPAQPGAPPAAPMPGQPPMGAPMPPPPPPALPTAEQVFMGAIKLLQNDKLRGFTISVETDSTIEPDAQVEMARRSEFLEKAAIYIEKAGQIGMMQPKLLPLLGKMLLFFVRGFGIGRDLETAFELTIQELENDVANPKPKPPTPEEIKAQTEQQKMQMEAQAQQQEQRFEMQRMQMEMQAEAQKMQMEMQKMQMELQAMREKLQMQQIEGQQKLQLKTQEMNLDAAANQQQAELDAQNAERQAAHDQQSMVLKADSERQSSELKLETQRRQAEQAAKAKPKSGDK